MEKNHLKIKMLGTSFSIQSSESLDHLDTILSYYKSKVEEINEKTVKADPLKLAIVAGLNIVDELFKEKKRKQQVSSRDSGDKNLELDKITERMINKINSSLQDNT